MNHISKKGLLTLDDISLSNKRVLIREDFNVPLSDDNKVTSDAKILASIPTINYVLTKKAKQICLISHLGRPSGINNKYSLRSVADILYALLGCKIEFLKDFHTPSNAPLVLYENVRFLSGETNNDFSLASNMASLCDVFIMDAFASAHLNHASTVGVCMKANVSIAGPLLIQELQALNKVMHYVKRPLLAIIGGSKVSTKIKFLSSLLNHVDYLIIGGSMANTFLAVQGYNIKHSLYETKSLQEAKRLLNSHSGHKIILPIDFKWCNCKIMDIGVESYSKFCSIIEKANTILWNGPMGVFEKSEYAIGTFKISEAISKSDAYSVIGGGDTLAVLDKLQIEQSRFTHISTGGGAFLKYIAGETLPAIKALIDKNKYGSIKKN